MEDPEHPGVLLGPAVGLLARSVRRPVVDDDDLHPVQAQGLPDDGLDAADEVRHAVVRGDDDADVGNGAVVHGSHRGGVRAARHCGPRHRLRVSRTYGALPATRS